MEELGTHKFNYYLPVLKDMISEFKNNFLNKEILYKKKKKSPPRHNQNSTKYGHNQEQIKLKEDQNKIVKIVLESLIRLNLTEF